MTTIQDPELYELAKALIDEIATWVQDTDIPEIGVQEVYPAENDTGGVFHHQPATKRSLELLFRKRSAARRDGEEVPGGQTEEEFREYIESKGYPLTTHTSRFFLNILGEQGEYIDSYEERFETQYQKIERAIETGKVNYTVKAFLRGIELSGDAVVIGDTATLREPTRSELTFDVERLHQLLPNMMPEVPDPAIIRSTVLEMQVQSPVGIGVAEGQIRQEILISALKLLDVGNITRIRTIYEPEIFLGASSRSEDTSGIQSPNPRATVSPEDGAKLENLYNLLRVNYRRDSREYGYPLSAALDHSETAISKRTYTRESVTFAIIAMEALYSGRKGIVTAYPPLLLGSVSEDFDPIAVRKNLKAGYNEHRNKWAHGGRRKRGEKKTQSAILNYVRSSIVIFLHLSYPEEFTKADRNEIIQLLERATIDEANREELLSRVQEIDLTEYLKNLDDVDL